MYIKFTDSDEECTKLTYDNENNAFMIQNSAGATICEFYPKLRLREEYKPDNFKYYLLYNDRDDYSENSIYQVNVDDKRIGWIFPLQALLSDQHDYSDNNYFLNYAFVAIYLLLNGINSREEKEISNEILLEDYYDEKSTILVLDDENLSDIQGFCLDNYIVSLYQYGYSFSGKGNLDSEIPKPGKRIKLKAISSKIQDIDYIYTLFRSIIPEDQKAFAKFHMYYQVIEILISIVLEDKLEKFIYNLGENEKSVFDKKEQLNSMFVEKNRVKWLFSNYVSVSSDLKNILDVNCKLFLKENDEKEFESVGENLYAVRNIIVHRMHSLDSRSHSLLLDIDIAFLDVLMETLLTFHLPE